MNLRANGKTGRHGQFTGNMPEAFLLDGDEFIAHESRTMERGEHDGVAFTRKSCLSNTPHRNCRKADRYARVSGPCAAKVKAAANRRFAVRRTQPSAGMLHRKTGTDNFLPAAVADESIVVARNDRRKIRTSPPLIAHRHGRHDGLSANDPEWGMTDEVLRGSQEELRRLSEQLLTIQESERQRIAADLHDGIGQSLNLIKVSVESVALLMQKGAHQEVADSLQQMIPRIRDAMAELRGITMDLRPAMLDDLGIIPTLSWFFREFETACRDKKVERDFSIAESDVPAPLKTTIFRILQEAMNNIVKHANATLIRVSLDKTDGVLKFSIEDNGQGFDQAGVVMRHGCGRGLGLLTMKERARSSNGVFEMQSTPGQGTRILISWRNMDDQIECRPGGA